jgi:hypothetical protein
MIKLFIFLSYMAAAQPIAERIQEEMNEQLGQRTQLILLTV